MLGLLQPEQFKIRIECTRESLHRLLTSAVRASLLTAQVGPDCAGCPVRPEAGAPAGRRHSEKLRSES